MKIQNSTDEDVVYEAKSDDPGGGPDPLGVLCGNATLACNPMGCAGILWKNSAIVDISKVDAHNSVEIQIHRKSDYDKGNKNQPVVRLQNLSVQGKTYTVKKDSGTFQIESL